MLTVPEEIKTLFQSDSIKKEIIVSFPNGELPDILCDQIVQDTFTFEESLCSQNDLQLGLCEASYVQFECVGIGNIKGRKIKVDCIVDVSSLPQEWIEENASYHEGVEFPFYVIPYGIFYVDSCAKKSGATKNHRTIKAFTREAYDDWELPESIQSALQLGWDSARTFKIPVDALLKTVAPNFCEGEWIDAPTTESYTTIYYFDSTGTRRNARLGFIYREIRPTFATGESKKIFRCIGSCVSDIDKQIERCKADLLAKAEEVGGRFAAFGNAFDYQYLSKIQKEVQLDYRYYGRNTSSKLVYPYFGYMTYEHLEDLTDTEKVDVTWYMHQEQESNIRTVNTIVSKVSILAGIYLSVPSEVMPDGWTTYNYFDSSLKYFYDSNFSPTASLSYTLDKARTAKVSTQNPTTYAWDVTNKTEYYLEKPYTISTRDIIEGFAELEGKLGKFNRFGELEFISLNGGIALYPSEDLYPREDLYPQEASIVLSSAIYQEAEWEDQFNKPFDRVSVDYKNENDETVYAYIDLVDHTSEDYNPDDYQSYTLGNNWFIKNQVFTPERIQSVLEHVADNISSIRYMPAEVVMRGLPYIEAGDYIEFLTQDRGFQTLVLRNTIDGEMYLQQVIESK